MCYIISKRRCYLMALKKGKMVYVSIDEEMEEKIDEYRRSQSPIPSRSEAIRQLIELGLAAST
jgi:metal-responsive CopG/Arc/MetJ family transcriptional regulator